MLKFGTTSSNTTTYRHVTLSVEGKVSKHLVHRLVANAVIPNTYNKPQVNHIDNNGSNNHVNNLEWCTPSENMVHCHVQGRCSNLVASDAAKDKATLLKRYSPKWKKLLGSRFIEFHLGREMEQVGVKSITAITYECLECEVVRTAFTNTKELVNGGICPNCYTLQATTKTEEDIV